MRAEKTQQQKHVAFKTAFDTFNGYLQQQNLIGAYVVAFSILEDRITAAYVLLQDLLKKPRSQERNFEKFKKMIGVLNANGHIKRADYDAYLDCSEQRNCKLHAAMWNLDEFSSNDCHEVIKLARKADKVSRELKKLSAQNENEI
jgi:hypothetical protein